MVHINAWASRSIWQHDLTGKVKACQMQGTEDETKTEPRNKADFEPQGQLSAEVTNQGKDRWSSATSHWALPQPVS